MSVSDPILDAILEQAPAGLFGEEQAPAAAGAYGLGTWKGCELKEVIAYPKSEHGMGYRIGLKVELKPDMPYTAKFDLERTLLPNGHDVEDWKLAKEAKKRAFLQKTLAAFDFNNKVEQAIDTDEQYDALINIFRQQVGKVCDLKVVEDGKNVKQDDGTWKFVPSDKGYTKVAWIGKSRVRK